MLHSTEQLNAQQNFKEKKIQFQFLVCVSENYTSISLEAFEGIIMVTG